MKDELIPALTGPEPEILLEQFMCQTVMENACTRGLLVAAGLEMDPTLKSREVLAEEASIRVAQELVGHRHGQGRLLGVQHALNVAKVLSLSVDNHGDISLLAQAIKSSRVFAKKVLTASKDGNEKSLFETRTRKDALHGSQWVAKMRSFFFSPDISRVTPGKDKVSIRRGVYAPKYLLKMSRMEAVKAFKSENWECPFSVSTLLCEAPQNCVLPKAQDFQRNVCPVHSNVCYLMETMRKEGILPISCSSCQLLCCEAMCSKEGLNQLETGTWDRSCALGNCKDCPILTIKVPESLQQKNVTVPQWEVRPSPTKKGKKVNSLWPVELTVQEAAKKLSSKMSGLKAHIYRAANQWKCCKADLENLKPGCLLTIEDYQMNLTVEFF